MSVGTGIFLGCLFLGIVALYAVTKDRWRWGTGLKRASIGLLVLTGVGVAVAVAWAPVSRLVDRPKPFNELNGVKLGASEDDVKFLKGRPAYICKIENDPIWTQYVYALEGTEEQIETAFLVSFKRDVGAWNVRIVASNGSLLNAPSLDGVSAWDSLEAVQSRFGDPSFVEPSEDGLSRRFYFRPYNLWVTYEQGRMKAYGVYHPERPDKTPPTAGSTKCDKPPSD
ncbi:MAG: hypothetical protein O9284_09425 [Steroidobacteraceae bacterium]|jgi:hypothetical protein|nr:hypothetical protein [Steroidobacteraceae bacterium]